MAVLDLAPRSARAAAACPTRLGHLRGADLSELIRLAPVELASTLARATIRRIRSMNERHVSETLRAERLSLIGQMAGSIVHDLKSPIAIVHNVAELVEEGTTTLPPAKMAALLRRSAARMPAMVQDILDFSRGGVRIHAAPTTVGALFEELDELALDGLEGRGIVVDRRLHYTGEISADLGVLVRGLVNLVKNAGEAMSSGGRLTLISVLQEGFVVLTIADTGGGIPVDLLPRLFEPFETRGKADGTGLGMAITKSAIDAHGGRIEVDSEPGCGTTFTIVLPLEARAAYGSR